MKSLYQSDLPTRSYLDKAIQDRVEAQARAAHLAVVGIEWAVTFLVWTVRTGFGRTAGRVKKWNSRRLTIRALSQLDDRMLRDIGVSPGDLYALATELVEHAPAEGSTVADLGDRPAAPDPVPLLRLDLDCPGLKHAA